MQSITLQSHVGKDGILQLQVPAEFSDADVQVTLALQKTHQNGSPLMSKDSGWPAGYLEKALGSWQGEFPKLEDEGEYEVREPLP
jgi:hypothetical protein